MKYLAIVLTAALLASQLSSQQMATFSTTANVVVVNVTVTSRDGKSIGSLTKGDFLLYEDGKLQTLQSCELQKIESRSRSSPSCRPKLCRPARRLSPLRPRRPRPTPAKAPDLRDRRLIVMLFDVSSMQPQEQIRAVDAAIKFLATQMTTSDMVSIMTFGTELKTVLDFTADRDQLISTLHSFHVGESSELVDAGGHRRRFAGYQRIVRRRRDRIQYLQFGPQAGGARRCGATPGALSGKESPGLHFERHSEDGCR